MILRSSESNAFSLAEVTIALGVAAFALIAIFGLLPVGLNSSQSAIEQTAAIGIVSAVISDLRATQPDSTTSDRLGIPIPSDLTVSSTAKLYFDEEGAAATSAELNPRYRLDIDFLPADHAQAPVQALLQITWPAAADPADAQGTVKVFSAFDRN